MTIVWVFLAAAAGTYLIRVSGVALLGGDKELPPRVTRALRLVAPAAMAAIVTNSLAIQDGGWRGFGAWHLAAAVAVAVAAWRRSAGVAMLAGAIAFAALRLAGV